MESNYYNKYLKYKNKYLSLQKNMLNQTGGNIKTDLMLFKAEWCGHCKNFIPVWNTLKNNTSLNKKFNFITYDSEKDSKVVSKLNIRGYPTLLIKKNDTVTEYNGARDFEYLNEYLNKF
uniref:Thioredoxin domain-containing protein n=1 Tax=viral metagenome TaxID=1070528 RepID=A0A6C0J4M4_9ZZZZ